MRGNTERKSQFGEVLMNDNNMRGAIWKNDRKEKDTHPDFRGTATIEGIYYWVSGWKRKEDASDRAPALSFSFQKKEQPQDQAQYSAAASEEAVVRTNDEIPF
jgi:hypothetical protein